MPTLREKTEDEGLCITVAGPLRVDAFGTPIAQFKPCCFTIPLESMTSDQFHLLRWMACLVSEGKAADALSADNLSTNAKNGIKDASTFDPKMLDNVAKELQVQMERPEELIRLVSTVLQFK